MGTEAAWLAYRLDLLKMGSIMNLGYRSKYLKVGLG